MGDQNKIFDFESLANQFNIDSQIARKLIQEAREEFPEDDMLFELHVTRAFRSIHRKMA